MLNVIDQPRDNIADKLDNLSKRVDTTKLRIKERPPLTPVPLEVEEQLLFGMATSSDTTQLHAYFIKEFTADKFFDVFFWAKDILDYAYGQMVLSEYDHPSMPKLPNNQVNIYY